ncbi:MAG: choice-of-anchor D domain-containing protein [Myxococcota bacterium]
MWRVGWMIGLFGLAGCIDFDLEKVKDPPVEGDGVIEADPGRVDFGTLASTSPVTETVTVTSIGELPVTVSTVDIAGSAAYALTWASTETVLAPGDTMDVVVTYTPASFDDQATLVVRSDAVEPELHVPLLGAGLYPAIAVEPSSVSFLSEYWEVVEEEVVVTSVGTADLVLSTMYVEGATWFSAEGGVPVTLAPGESTPLTVRYTPDVEGENVAGKLWLTTNTAAGFAVVPLDAMYGTPCVGMGEAWDRGLLSAETLFDGLTLELTNRSADEEICIDRWYVYLATLSQDLGAGDMDADFGDAYPNGSITIPPLGSVQFEASQSAGEAWWCMEQTQYTDRNQAYTFIGAYVPEPLLSSMLAADQDGVWDWMAANPVMIAARGTNYVEVSAGGGSAPVTLRVINMGGRASTAEVRESVPAGWTATDFSETPARTEVGTDGETVHVWDVTLAARVETGLYEQTLYDERSITYTLTVPPCRGRQYADPMYTSWRDTDDTARIASANPLVVNCVE